MSSTLIHDQLVRELKLRALTAQLSEGLGVSIAQAMASLKRAMESAGSNLARFAVRLAEAQLGTPEDVLERIRRDQATLDWQESWRAERER